MSYFKYGEPVVIRTRSHLYLIFRFSLSCYQHAKWSVRGNVWR